VKRLVVADDFQRAADHALQFVQSLQEGGAGHGLGAGGGDHVALQAI
jgi:hypothetical protein